MALDLFSCMRSFIAVAEYNGFAAAARHLHLSPPVLTKQIQFLEHRLKKMLLERTTRHLELTEAGQLYLEQAKAILEELQQAEASLHELETEPHGMLNVGASGLINTPGFTKHLHQFLKKYPKISLNIQTEVSPQWVLDGHLHLSITEENLFDNSLIKDHFTYIRRRVYAAPSYLQERGVPQTMQDLQKHQCLIFQKALLKQEWILGKNQRIKVSGQYRTNSSAHFMLALKAGFGLGWCFEHLVQDEIAAGLLQEVQLNIKPIEIPVFIYYRPSSQNIALKKLLACFKSYGTLNH